MAPGASEDEFFDAAEDLSSDLGKIQLDTSVPSHPLSMGIN